MRFYGVCTEALLNLLAYRQRNYVTNLNVFMNFSEVCNIFWLQTVSTLLRISTNQMHEDNSMVVAGPEITYFELTFRILQII